MTRILDARCPARDTAGAPHGSVALWITAWTWVIEDGCDATILAVPRGGGAIWGRDRIEEDWGGGFDAGYPQCPGSIGPSGAEIVLSGRQRWTLLRPPLPAVLHEDAPRTGRAAGEAAATLGRYRHCPGSGAHPGQRSYWACAGVEAPPPPGSYLECPRRTRLRPALGLAGRLQHAGAIPPMPRVGGPSGAEIVLGRAPTVGRPHHPGHTPSAPEGSASDEDQLGGRDGTGESGAAMAFAWAANAISAAGSLRIRWMPRVVGRRWAALTRAGAASWPLVRRRLGSAQTPGAPVARGGLVV